MTVAHHNRSKASHLAVTGLVDLRRRRRLGAAAVAGRLDDRQLGEGFTRADLLLMVAAEEFARRRATAGSLSGPSKPAWAAFPRAFRHDDAR